MNSMKTTIHLLLLLFYVFTTSAQSSVSIQINHLLNGEDFEANVTSQNDFGNAFMLDRLEYYLSGFAITHDGGQVTEVDDLYVHVDFVNKKNYTTIDLGEFDIDNLESVSFFFGIDEEANHGDPSLWPSDHPLAPKFPSMHWGWAAGYRFIALEGMSGPNVDQDLQFHCIGDEFYKKMEYPVSMSGEDAYTVEIDAEYNNLLSNIDISGGLIIHGNLGAIKILATNLREKVYTMATSTSTSDSELVKSFEAYPNPVIDGIFTIETDVLTSNNSINIYDAMGREVKRINAEKSRIINLTEKGMYFIALTDFAGNTLATRKIIVQ